MHEYVLAHLDVPIPVAGMAARAGMTASRFTRAFKALQGSTPHAYVLRQRIDHAIYLLQCRHMEAVQVAAACGFSSQQHLISTMRRLVGKTPGQVYREAHRASRIWPGSGTRFRLGGEQDQDNS